MGGDQHLYLADHQAMIIIDMEWISLASSTAIEIFKLVSGEIPA